MPPPPTPPYRAWHLAGVGTDDVPDLPAWCAESGCDACRQFDEEPLPGRQPPMTARARSLTARLPRHRRARYP